MLPSNAGNSNTDLLAGGPPVDAAANQVFSRALISQPEGPALSAMPSNAGAESAVGLPGGTSAPGSKNVTSDFIFKAHSVHRSSLRNTLFFSQGTKEQCSKVVRQPQYLGW